MDFEHLSDEELRQQLVANGVNAGPITATTRGIYVKKLYKILGSSPAAVPANLAAPIGDHDNVIPEEPTVQKNIYPVLETPEPRQRRKPQPTPPAHEGQESDFEEGEESMRYLTEEEMFAEANRSRRHSPQPTNSSNVSRVMYLGLAVVAAVFLFFLFEGTMKGNKEHV